MSDLISTLATQTGIDPATIQKGLGAVLTFLKEHLGGEHFEKVQSAVPGAQGMMETYSAAAAQEGESPGLFEKVASLAGSLFAGRASTPTCS